MFKNSFMIRNLDAFAAGCRGEQQFYTAKLRPALRKPCGISAAIQAAWASSNLVFKIATSPLRAQGFILNRLSKAVELYRYLLIYFST
jgi:hypothetical protein